MENNWVPISSGLFPEDGEYVQVTFIGYHDHAPHCEGFAYRKGGNWYWTLLNKKVEVEIIAWKENCEPYKETNMETIKVHYAIEKEMEVPKNFNNEMIEKIILKKCKEENGIDTLWDTEDGLKQLGLTGLFDVIKK